MRLYRTLAAALLTASALQGQSPTTKSTTPVRNRIPVHTSSARKPPAHQAASHSYTPPRQAGPTQDRYREIQESLISKGYMQSPATGVWDQNSMDAMRKFQTDQKMEPTGKISAKALITLGLGPKDETVPPATTTK